ncbi:unnamed protein product, partial [Heterotrigona itama]
HVFSPILRFPSADVRLLRALLQESGETINTSLQNGEGTEQATLLGELCVSNSSEKRRAQAWLQADMPGYEREKMMRRRVAPAFYPLPLVGDLVDRDSRPRLHDFDRAGTTSGLIHTPSVKCFHSHGGTSASPTGREKREEKEKNVGRASNNAISIPEISGVLPSGTWSVGHDPVRWHPPGQEWGEGARGPIIAESGGCPWLRPGSRGRDAPRLEDSRLVAECLLFSSGAKKDSRPLRFVSKGVGPLRAFVCRARLFHTLGKPREPRDDR